jgi:hypothetical protein
MDVPQINLLREGLEQGKGFSIITNFGCDKNCWYCIWKNHPMNTCTEIKTDFENLQQALAVVGLYQCASKRQVTVRV